MGFGVGDRFISKYLSAVARQGEEFIVTGFIDLLGAQYFFGIGAEHAGHVGVDFTAFRMECSGKGKGGGVGASPSQGGDLALLTHALVASHDDNSALR